MKHSNAHITPIVPSKQALKAFAGLQNLAVVSGVVPINPLFSKRYIFSSFKDFNTSARA